MEFPALLPEVLKPYQVHLSEDELFNALTKHLPDVMLFFEAACDDETWADEHAHMIRKMLRWITRKYALNKVSLIYAQKVARVIQRHYPTLQPYLVFRSVLFYSVNFIVKEQSHWVNSFIFAVSSPFFKEWIQKHAWDKFQNRIVLSKASLEHFEIVSEYIYTGHVRDLWKKEFKDALKLMQQAIDWELPGLVLQCVDVLRRYLNRDNVVEILFQAQRQGLVDWKHACYQYFNSLNWGLRFLPKGPELFAVEFLDFNTETIELFNLFSSLITHIAFRGVLKERPVFNSLINRCPKLIGIDISGFQTFSEYLSDLPENVFDMIPVGIVDNLQELLMTEQPSYVADFLPTTLIELDISDSSWLKPIYLKFIFMFCPQLKKLSLAGNTQLNYEAWGLLSKLPRLISLNLMHCKQVNDDDLRSIVHACPWLDDLVLEDCPRISDMGFMDMIGQCQRLSHLNLSYTSLTNKTLVEIANISNELTHLSIKGCEGVNERGLAALARGCFSLKFLDVQECRLKEETVAHFQSLRPTVHVVF